MDNSVIVIAVVLVMALRLSSIMTDSPCTLKDCNCIKGAWTHFSQGNKFIKVNKAAANFSTSALLCEKLGGQLLTIRDAKTLAFVEDFLARDNPLGERGASYWIGLTRKGIQWKWIDGSDFLAKEYKNWLKTPTGRHVCTEIVTPGKANWTTESCGLSRHHICEATKPCAPRPAITINGVAMLRAADVFLAKDREVEVMCFVPGYFGQVEKVRIDCPDGQTMSSQWNWASLAIAVRLRMHGNKCVCTATLRDKSTEKSEVTLSVLTKPFLVDKRDNDKSVFMRMLGVLTLEVIIHSNPEPYIYRLFKNKVPVEQDKFEVIASRLEEPLHYALEIVVQHSTHDRGAYYTMMIGNEVDDDFELRFHPVVYGAAMMDPTDRACSPVSLIVTALVIAAFLFMGLVFLCTGEGPDTTADDKDIIGARTLQWYHQPDSESDEFGQNYNDDRSTQPRSSISNTDLQKLRQAEFGQLEADVRNEPA